MKPIATKLAIGALALLAAAAGLMVGQHREPPPPAAAPAPSAARLDALTLPDLAGKPQPLGQWAGKLRVVNFWATWCTPCREEMPMFAKLAKEHGERLQFIGIGIDSIEAMQAFSREMPMPYPLLVGGNDVIELSAQLGNESMGLPFTVVIDSNGAVRAKHMGKISESQLREMLGI